MILSRLKSINVLNLTVLLAAFVIFLVVVFFPKTYAKDPKQRAMIVEVSVIKEQPMRIWRKFSGRLTAVDFVEIKPQASGIITDVRFKDGQFVNKGDILYIIDSRPYKAAVMEAKADLITALNRKNLAEK